MRGLVPVQWTQQALPTEEVKATGVCTQADLDGSLYWFGTDGSGGPHSNDPRMRRCAWSVVALDSQYQVVGSLARMLTGTANQHTVPRAEARAFLALLQATSNEPKVAVDAKYMCAGAGGTPSIHKVCRRMPWPTMTFGGTFGNTDTEMSRLPKLNPTRKKPLFCKQRNRTFLGIQFAQQLLVTMLLSIYILVLWIGLEAQQVSG